MNEERRPLIGRGGAYVRFTFNYMRRCTGQPICIASGNVGEKSQDEGFAGIN